MEPNPPPYGLVPGKNKVGEYDLSDPWLFVGEHPEFHTIPIPNPLAAQEMMDSDDSEE